MSSETKRLRENSPNRETPESDEFPKRTRTDLAPMFTATLQTALDNAAQIDLTEVLKANKEDLDQTISPEKWYRLFVPISNDAINFSEISKPTTSSGVDAYTSDMQHLVLEVEKQSNFRDQLEDFFNENIDDVPADDNLLLKEDWDEKQNQRELQLELERKQAQILMQEALERNEKALRDEMETARKRRADNLAKSNQLYNPMDAITNDEPFNYNANLEEEPEIETNVIPKQTKSVKNTTAKKLTTKSKPPAKTSSKPSANKTTHPPATSAAPKQMIQKPTDVTVTSAPPKHLIRKAAPDFMKPELIKNKPKVAQVKSTIPKPGPKLQRGPPKPLPKAPVRKEAVSTVPSHKIVAKIASPKWMEPNTEILTEETEDDPNKRQTISMVKNELAKIRMAKKIKSQQSPSKLVSSRNLTPKKQTLVKTPKKQTPVKTPKKQTPVQTPKKQTPVKCVPSRIQTPKKKTPVKSVPSETSPRKQPTPKSSPKRISESSPSSSTNQLDGTFIISPSTASSKKKTMVKPGFFKPPLVTPAVLPKPSSGRPPKSQLVTPTVFPKTKTTNLTNRTSLIPKISSKKAAVTTTRVVAPTFPTKPVAAPTHPAKKNISLANRKTLLPSNLAAKKAAK